MSVDTAELRGLANEPLDESTGEVTLSQAYKNRLALRRLAELAADELDELRKRLEEAEKVLRFYLDASPDVYSYNMIQDYFARHGGGRE